MEAIYFYSKYSKHCKDLQSKINTDEMFTYCVCIDNESARGKVKSVVTSVPTVLLRYEDKILKIIQGSEQILVWLQQQIPPEEERHEVPPVTPIQPKEEEQPPQTTMLIPHDTVPSQVGGGSTSLMEQVRMMQKDRVQSDPTLETSNN